MQQINLNIKKFIYMKNVNISCVIWYRDINRVSSYVAHSDVSSNSSPGSGKICSFYSLFFCRKVHAYLYIKDKGQEKLPWITWTVKVP